MCVHYLTTSVWRKQWAPLDLPRLPLHVSSIVKCDLYSRTESSWYLDALCRDLALPACSLPSQSPKRSSPGPFSLPTCVHVHVPPGLQTLSPSPTSLDKTALPTTLSTSERGAEGTPFQKQKHIQAEPTSPDVDSSSSCVHPAPVTCLVS